MPPVTLNEALIGLTRRDTVLRFWRANGEIAVDYSQLCQLIAGNAVHFRSLGVRRRDWVMICLRSDLEHVVAFLALIALGAVPVSIKPPKTSGGTFVQGLVHLWKKFGISYGYHTLPVPPGVTPVAWCPSAIAAISTAIAEVDQRDVAFVQFSSGSTSAPKAIPISHANLMANLATILAVDNRGPHSSGFNFLPLNHDMGLVGGLLSNLIYQNSLVLTGIEEFLRHPIAALANMHKHRVDVMAMPDFALRYIARYLTSSRSVRFSRSLFSNILTIYCGAEPIRYDSVSRFLDVTEPLGLNPQALLFCYGLSEATLLVTGRRFTTLPDSFVTIPPSRTIARVGPVLGGMEVCLRLRDKQGGGLTVEDEKEGVIQIRGPSLFRGYWGEPARCEDNWFETGDIGFVRHGELHISGRSKDLIVVNGENLFPDDIENAIDNLPGLRESLVMVEDERFYVFAVQSLGTHINPDMLSSLISQQFGVVPQVVVMGPPNHIVRTSSGKPIRSATLDRLRDKGLLPQWE